MVGTVTARVSVLPVVGSELPTNSDAVVDCTARVDEVMDDALVGLSVGQSCVRRSPNGFGGCFAGFAG